MWTPCPAMRVCVCADLAVFVNTADPEADLFVGLTSLQVHRRARTLARVADLVRSQDLSVRTLRDVVVILALHMLHDAVKDPTEKRVRTTDQSNLAGLHAKAIEVVAAIAQLLDWAPYLHLLRTVLIEVGWWPGCL